MLKEKVLSYFEESGIPKTVFCRRIGISTHHLYEWLKGGRNISDALSVKISNYIEAHSVK